MNNFMRDFKREISTCPDCGLPLQFNSGCMFCPRCGFSPCGKMTATIGGFSVMMGCLFFLVML